MKGLFQRNLFSIILVIFVVTFLPDDAAEATEFTDWVRTVKLPEEYDVVLTIDQTRRGKFLFGKACASCHVGGLTKPNPNVGLDIRSLQTAIPRRDNVTSLIDFIISPRWYDNQEDISDLHPCPTQARLYIKVRSLKRFDCFCLGGHILLQAKVLGEKWGGGKIYY